MKTIAKLMALCMLLGTLAIAQDAPAKPADQGAAAAAPAPDASKAPEKKAKKEKKSKKESKKKDDAAAAPAKN